MTELEQYQKAYSTLAGRVGRIVTKMDEIITVSEQDAVLAWMSSSELKKALQEARQIVPAKVEDA